MFVFFSDYTSLSLSHSAATLGDSMDRMSQHSSSGRTPIPLQDDLDQDLEDDAYPELDQDQDQDQDQERESEDRTPVN